MDVAYGQQEFVATTLGSAFEVQVVAFGLEVAVGVVVDEGDAMASICTPAPLRLIASKPERRAHVVLLTLR